MIITIDQTTTREVNSRLVALREEGGAVALGRVLTLVIDAGKGDVEAAIKAANEASREHPCRIIVIQELSRRHSPRLDAEIRVGGDAGASEVVILRVSGPVAASRDTLVMSLLLPDAPIVVWWPNHLPLDPGTDELGRIATLRITDIAQEKDCLKALRQLAAHYTEGDTDLAWTRITPWRAVIAASLDTAPREKVKAVTVYGPANLPGVNLIAGWMALALNLEVQLVDGPTSEGITRVEIERASGTIIFSRPRGHAMTTLTTPGQPIHKLAVAIRSNGEALAEELRRLDPDHVYRDVLRKGIRRLTR